MNTVSLLYELQERRILLWKNNEGNLSFSLDRNLGFPEALKERVKKHKTELLCLLEYNQIYSEAKASQVSFYKIPDHLNEKILQTIQQGMYLQSTLDEQKATYTVPLFVLFKQADAKVLKQAIQQLVNLNPILRMRIVGGTHYEILPENSLTISESTSTSQQLTAICEQKGRRAFAVDNEALIHLELIHLSDTQELLVSLTHHHMLSDAYSADLMINKLVAQYHKMSSADLIDSCQDRAFHYFDYTCFQHYVLQTEPYQQAIAQLAYKLDSAEPLNLATRTATSGDNRAGLHEFTLDKETYKMLEQFAVANEISLYSLLLTSLYQVLSVYSGGQTHFPIALTVSNRLPEMNQVIGPFINTLPLIPDYKKEQTVLEQAKKMHAAVSFLNEYHQMNLNVLAQHLKRSHEDLPALMQVLFTFHNFKQVISPLAQETAQPILLPDCYEKFGISIIAKASEATLHFTVTYVEQRYEGAFIEGLFTSFVNLLTKYGAGAWHQNSSALHLLNDQSWHYLVEQLNQTEVPFPQKTINQLFEEQVERTPDRLAVIYENKCLTYRELNQQANQLAHYLQNQYALMPDTLVCLCLERSEQMIISILAVLKAGAAYVPIAPDFPQARIAYLIEDTQTPFILTNQSYQAQLQSFLSVPVHAVDAAAFLQQLAGFSVKNVQAKHSSEHLAYVIYTSGTTGQPKGVMLEHRGVVNRIHWMNRQYPLDAHDRIIQKTPYVFDVSVWELFWAHWYGACLVFAKPEGHKDAQYLYELMRRESITIAHFVPSMLHVFMDSLKVMAKTLPQLQKIFCSGEALKLAQVKQVHALLPDTEIHNLYGPTEASIDVLYADCSDKSLSQIVIGKPIDNTTAYVLDAQMNPVPFYAWGELYLGGVGLARGYLNRPELTMSRFIANPLQSMEHKERHYNGRLYKTGDVVSLLPDGSLLYHGRNDFQVKIRGHRIELGEIEQVLLRYPGVAQSLVVVKQHLDKAYLLGYYVSDTACEEQALLHFLEEHLPEYMVPSRILHLTALPLTANGKLDVKNLPEPERALHAAGEMPATELEQQLSALWSEVLGIKGNELSVHDDFFRLGGDSIIIIQLISRLRQRLHVHLSAKDLFSYRTLRRLHDKIVATRTLAEEESCLGEQGLLTGRVALLPIQRWFFAQSLSRAHHWNQSFLVKTPELDVAHLRHCLEQLVQHHDAFRLRFSEEDGEMVQYYDAKSPLPELHILDVGSMGLAAGSEALEAQLTQWQAHFNWTKGPLYCIAYLYGYPDGSARLYFALHHLVVDAVSWRILVDDLHRLYNGQSLGAKGSSYRQWGAALASYAQQYASERAYWHEVLADINPHFGADWPMGLSTAALELDVQQTSFLLREANEAYHTQVPDLLLTALAYALQELSGEAVHHVTLEGHGREDIAATVDVSHTVGWFTSLYPVRLAVDSDLAASIKAVKDNLRQIPGKGLGYGALFGYEIADMPVISFNYLGQFEPHSEAWQWVDEAAGQAMHPENQEIHLVTCFGGIHQGRLKITFRTKLAQDIADRLTLAYHQQLLAIIEHQRTLKRTFLTRSDVNYCVSASCLQKLQEDREIEGVYLANSLHQGFIYHALSQGYTDEAYRMQIVWTYDCQVDPSLLHKAWSLAQQRYPSLRLRFLVDEELLQVIDKTGQINWRFIDLSQECREQAQKIEQLIQEDRQTAYDLARGNLFRICLIKQDPMRYTCIFNAHHAIIDGWSGPLLLGFVHEVYMQLFHGQPIDFAADSAYTRSQHYLQVHEAENQSYWHNYVAQVEHKADLSYLLSDNKKQVKLGDYKYVSTPSVQAICLDNERFKQLKEMSQKQGVTLNAVVLYAWHKVLSIYGHGKQTVIGTIVSGRNLPVDQIEQSVGLYINNLPMIVDHAAHAHLSVLEAIGQIQNISNEMNQRSAMSLAKLQSHGERLFDCLFMYGNYPNLLGENAQKQLPFTVQSTFEKFDYPLSVAVDEEKNCLNIKLTYAGELFAAELMQQLLETLNYLLEQIAANPTQLVRELSYTQKMLPEEGVAKRALKHTLIDCFEETAAMYPERIALVYEDRQLSYAQLNSRANQLAHYLHQHMRDEHENLIALCFEKDEYLLIALLAVLKAGAAYMLLDPHMPAQRLAGILKESQARFVLSTEAVSLQLEQAIILDNPGQALILSQQPATNLQLPIQQHHLAYVIYTSGTTGQPKGVMIEHGALLHTLLSLQEEYFPKQKSLNTYSMTHFVFDIFALEYGLPLITGGMLQLGNPLFTTLDCRHFDFLQMTPSVCELKLDALTHCEATLLFLGGEAVSAELLSNALSRAQRVVNVYGPTETTIWSTSKLYTSFATPVSIGKPLNQEKAYVLDDYLIPLPAGAVGALYLGGVGLARGYLNRPELTAEKFITAPWLVAGQNPRLYQTGDLAKCLPNGELVFIGRTDFQVKIRGHRIELAEIEVILRTYPGVKQSVVVAMNQSLVAYYTAPAAIDEQQLAAFLKQKLPDYMLPQVYLHLEHFPLTVTGKLNRKALPSPNLTKRAQYVEPRTEQEKFLASLWEEVLGVRQISVHDNFFDLGGHSILLIKFFSKLPEEMKTKLSLLDLFQLPSISAIAAYLSKGQQQENKMNKQALSQLKQDDIAIIGMAGRFPGADDLDTFWTNLQAGKESITYYSREELLAQGLDSALVDHPNYVKAQCKLSNIKCFDADFFGYTPAEAEVMDPQHRLLMQCAWDALHDANYNPHHYAGDIGLYAGCGQNNYFTDHVLPNQKHHDLPRQFQLMIHQQANFLCTKIAYKLNLTGPAITVQTACSTSLVAVHQACLALNAGDCDMALAGGVSIGQLEKQGYLYQPGLIFSPDAKCRVFDAQAQGTFEGQGVGLVVLKPLSKALADDDFIYAVIKGSAINNDGHQKIGFTAPSSQKQAKVIALAQQRAGCSPETISCIEAHGTGTVLGDPIEMEGLALAFQQASSQSGFCALGSVKTNIGHLDVAAGIAGLIKMSLCLHHKQLVPSLHYQAPNDKINFSNSPFYVNTVLTPWQQTHSPRRAGISSFGIGGTNAHLILEEAPAAAKTRRIAPKPYPLAKTEYWLPAVKAGSISLPQVQVNNVMAENPDLILASLQQLWTELLGVQSFNSDQDFFELGGDSLAAVQLAAQLKKQLGVHLELMSLNRITISGLLTLIEAEKSRQALEQTSVVMIQPGKPDPGALPLILIHPIGGDIYFYRDLAKALPESQAVYALRSPLLDGEEAFASIESMAQSYVDRLSRFGLQPPYILGGSSFGGAVALEMARHLMLANHSLPLVVLIDTPAYTNLPKLMNQEEILTYLMRHGLGNLHISADELAAQSTLEQKIAFIANQAKNSELKDLLSTEFLPKFLQTWQYHGQILHQYTPEPYLGSVLFFAHTEVIDDFPPHQAMHWKQLIQGAFKQIAVPGTHITMNAAPHVQVIADSLVFELKRRYYSQDFIIEAGV